MFETINVDDLANSAAFADNMHMRRALPVDSSCPMVMGILNVTPDSFSDGGEFLESAAALQQASRMIAEGARIIDVGGESSRPGATRVPAAEQIRRTEPVIAAIRENYPDIHISIDTRSAQVAASAVSAGANIVNDISALHDDPRMVELVAERDLAVVLMHMQGTPQTMQHSPHYDDVTAEVYNFLEQRIEFAMSCGIKRERIIVDPGLGFGKSVQHNILLLAALKRLAALGPLLVGASRKSFIAKLLDLPYPNTELTGTTALNVIALLAGASILRVHDVLPAAQSIALVEAVRRAHGGR